MLVLIVGLPGTGKTTFATELAKKMEAVHLNTDIIRSALGQRGKYDSASKASVYKELYAEAEEVLQQRKGLVVDATLYKEALRQPFEKMATHFDIPIIWIELRADESTIKERVGKKRQYSEADFDVYLKIKAIYEPITQNHLVLWSDVLSLKEMVDKALEYFKLSEFTPK